MRDRLIQKFTKAKKGSLGYTLTEMLVVVGIIVVLLAIAIPSVITISKALRFRQRNDYAKAIFMAAQANLTEMRSDGGLSPLQGDDNAVTSRKIPAGNGFPDEHRKEYVFVSSDMTVTNPLQRDSYALVLPVGSVESQLRAQHVIIEYNPVTGNVYSVFYCEDDLVKGTGETLLQLYNQGKLPRNAEGDEAKRKDMMVGYYDGSGLSSTERKPEFTKADVVFENGQEGMVTVRIPMPSAYYEKRASFVAGLQVDLTVRGEHGGEFTVRLLSSTNNEEQPGTAPVTLPCTTSWAPDGITFQVTASLDSLVRYGSFANLSTGTYQEEFTGGTDLTEMTEDAFEDKILPGDNVSLEAEVEFFKDAGSNTPDVEVDSGRLSRVNPMFDYLQESAAAPDTYTLAVANGRNLQNLNALHPAIGAKVTNVVFTSDIDWNTTVEYYNEKYSGHACKDEGSTSPDGFCDVEGCGDVEGEHHTFKTAWWDRSKCSECSKTRSEHHTFADSVTPADGNCDICGHGAATHPAADAYISSLMEAPARALPYFVPIHNESLFGTASFEYISTNEWLDQLPDWLKELLESIFAPNSRVPTLTDERDAGVHAAISGSRLVEVEDAEGNVRQEPVGTRIYNLNIDSTRNPVGKSYYAGTPSADNDRFTGLFSYANTTIDNLHIVNPIVKGYWFTAGDTNNPATGALLGAGGYNTYIASCSVYVDKSAPGYDNAKMYGQANYSKDTAQQWYGVSGEGAVGGLVGYAKSHRTTNGALDGDKEHLAFYKSFAAVNVSGNLRAPARKSQSGVTYYGYDKDYGYSTGIGGFIGNSQLTNFYHCYASGNVMATNVNVADTFATSTGDFWQAILDLIGISIDFQYSGRESAGAGGFVGTSHGTRYTNCFASGTVTAANPYSSLGAGGFVGAMCIDETFAYGNQDDSAVTNAKIAQRTVFTDCYSVGLVTVNNTPGECFSGATCRVAFDLEEFATAQAADYYRLLAPHYELSGGALPDYEDFYIYKDSYYLSNYYLEDPPVNSNNCASPAVYETLLDLPTNHQSAEWIAKQIKDIKAVVIKDNWILDDWTYQNTYFDDNPGLEAKYAEAYRMGYTSGWGPAAETHGYDLNGRYPFSMLSGLPYYGDWPAKPLSLGIAYYEDYSGANVPHYHFDRETTSQILTSGTSIVISDGYAILSASANAMTITVNGVESEYDSGETDGTPTIGGNQFNAYHLTEAQLAAAVEFVRDTGEFYVPVTVTQDGVTSTYYFNPAVASSHVNGHDGQLSNHTYTDADSNKICDLCANARDDAYHQPTGTNFAIRSARQFAALSAMENFWTEDYTYTQQMNIDADAYVWGSTEETNVVPALKPIGSAGTPFNAVYTGATTEIPQALLAGFLPGTSVAEDTESTENTEPVVTGLFGAIGEYGTISDVLIRLGDNNLDAVQTLQVSGMSNNAAILAAASAGTIENVDIVLLDQLVLQTTAENSRAGLLAGAAAGTITDCDITVAESVAINAAHAGILVGYAQELTADNCNVILAYDKLTMDDEAELASFYAEGQYVGAFAGWLNQSVISNVNVTLEGMYVSANYAGGFAGNISGGSVTDLDVSITGDAANVETETEENPAYLAGIASNVNGEAVVSNVTAQINGELTADNAAGLFGLVDASAVNATAILNDAAIVGRLTAAGAAIRCGVDGNLDNTIVELGEGTVQSTEGKAAGFAVDAQGTIQGAQIQLGAPDETASDKIKGKTEAAGFACSVSGKAGAVRVFGAGIISAEEKAAGFAISLSGAEGQISVSGVTPAMEESKAGYLGNSNNKLKVTAAEAAGFVLNVEKSTGTAAGIFNSYVLAKVTGHKAYGFSATNAGTIEGCTANVTFENVDTTACHAFVGTNSGTVSNSYGWYGDGRAAGFDKIQAVPTDDTGAYTDSGKYFSCYFVDINMQQDEDSEENTVTLFDINGKMEPMLPATLAADSTLLLLNGPEGQSTYRWRPSATYDAYSYSEFKNPKYLYPMLREHRGDWVTTPEYAFGIGYYEMCVDANGETIWHLRVDDLSTLGETIEAEELDVSGIYNAKGEKIEGTLFGPDVTIQEAGYLVFAKVNKDGTAAVQIFGKVNGAEAALIGKDQTRMEIPGAVANPDKPNRYGFFKLDAAGKLEIVDQEMTIIKTLITWYADTVNQVEGDPYKIRTADQLANVKEMPGASFVQTHNNVATSDFTTIPSFTGDYNGNGYTITATGDAANSWMTTVSGTVQNLTLNLSGVNAPVFGTVAEGKTVSLNSLTTGTIGAGGAVFGSVAGSVEVKNSITAAAIAAGSDTVAAGKLFGDVSGTVTTGNVSVTGAVDGQLFGTINGKTEVGAVSTGAVSGQIFGNVTVGAADKLEVTSVNTNGSSVSGQIFGNVKNVTIRGAVATGEITATGKVFGNVTTGGTVTVGNITTGAVSKSGTNAGQIFGEVTGTVETGNINISGSVGGNVFGGSTGTITVGAVNNTGAAITTNGNAVSGQIFGNVATATVNGAITAGEITSDGQIFGNAIGTVSVDDITVGKINAAASENEHAGRIFGSVSGKTTVGTISTGAVDGQIFGAVNTTSAESNLTVTGITTNNNAVSGQIFGDVQYVTVTNGISTGAVNANAQIFGAVNGTVNVNGTISTAAVSGKVFGDSTGSITVAGITTNNNAVSGQIFGDVAKAEVTGDIAVGEVAGKIFGTVNTEATIGGKITVDTSKTLSGKIFEAVSANGSVSLTNGIATGEIASTGMIFGNVSGSVTIGTDSGPADFVAITTGDKTVSGQIFGDVKNVTVNGAITAGEITSDGQIFGNVTGTVSVDDITVGKINAAASENEHAGQVFGNVIAGGNVQIGNITVAANNAPAAVNGQIFGIVNGQTTVGAISTGVVSGQVFGNVTVAAADKLEVTSVNTNGNAVSGQIFGNVNSGSVTVNGSITTGAVSGKLFGEVKANVTLGGITTGAATSSLITKLSGNAVMTTGNINVASLGASLVGAFDGGTLQGVESKTQQANIQITSCEGIAQYLFSGNVGGTVKNYQTTVDACSTGLTNELSGAMENVTLTVNAETMTADVITTFSGTTLSGLTVTVNGSMGGSLIKTATKDVSGLTLTVIGNMTADVISEAAGVTGLTVTVGTEKATDYMQGNVIGTASGNVTTLNVTVNGYLKGSVIGTAAVDGDTNATVSGTTATIHGHAEGNLIGTVDGAVNSSKLTVDGALTGDGLTKAGSVNTLTIEVGNTLTGNAVGTVTNAADNITVNVTGNLTRDALISAGSVKDLNVSVTGDMGGRFVGETGSLTGSAAGKSILHVTGNVSGDAIGTVNDEVKNITLDIDKNLSGNAIGTVGDATTLNLTVDGILSDSAIGTANGNLSGVTVEAGTVQVTANGNFGVITAELANGQTLSGSSVNVDELNVTVNADGISIGGLVGVNNGTINSSRVNNKAGSGIAVMNVTGIANSKSVNVGGLVGQNNSAVTLSGQSGVNITYKQANSDSVTIGGIVGLMNGGTLNGTAGSVYVAGEINLDGSAAAGYKVGGAVGHAGTVEVKNVAVAVVIDTDWANTTNDAGVFTNVAMNKGSVGMFVGYSDYGTFTNCFSVAANGTYQFLGKTEIELVNFGQNVTAYTSTVSGTLLKAYSDIVDANGNPALFEVTDAEGNVTKYDPEKAEAIAQIASQYTSVSANLNGAYFYLNGTLQEQKYADGEIYYNRGNDVNQSEYCKNAEVVAEFGNTRITISESRDFSGEYYYYKTENNEYGRVTQASVSGFIYYTLTLKYIGADGNEATYSTGKVGSSFQVTLYTLNAALTNSAKYVVASDGILIGEGPTSTQKTTFKQRDPEMSKFIFVYADSKLGNHAVTLVRENYYGTGEHEAKFTVEGLSLGDITQFNLYTVAVDPDSYAIYQFTPMTDAQYSRQKLTYDAAPTSIVAPQAIAMTSLLDETDLPAVSGEVPEGTETAEGTESTESTEMTESTEATEVTTEPPAAEDGTNE